MKLKNIKKVGTEEPLSAKHWIAELSLALDIMPGGEAEGQLAKAGGEAVESIIKNNLNDVIGKVGKYQVGAYQDIKGVAGLDAHHVGQKTLMKDLVEKYDPMTAPAINVPKVGHTISGPNGIVSRSTKDIYNARQLLARILWN